MKALSKWWAVACSTVAGVSLAHYFGGVEFIIDNDRTYITSGIALVWAAGSIIAAVAARKADQVQGWLKEQAIPESASSGNYFLLDVVDFLSSSCVRLGLIGTVVGLIMMSQRFRNCARNDPRRFVSFILTRSAIESLRRPALLMSKRTIREKLSTVFMDLFMNSTAFLLMVLVVILLIFNTKESDPAIEDKNKFVITTDWLGTSEADVDLWIRAPDGSIVGHTRKQANGTVLQRDDTGVSQDKIVDADGNTSWVYLNREIINIRKPIPGRYIVMVVMFHNDEGSDNPPEMGVTKGPVEVETELLQMDPFKQVPGKTVTLFDNCQRRTVIVFEINQKLELVTVPNDEIGEATFRGPTCSGSGHP